MEEHLNKIICADSLDFMKSLPDKCIDLVLTDPPYGLGDRLSDGGGKLKNTPMAVLYRDTDWVDEVPSEDVFKEIFRISKNQIICGGNYFNLPPTRGFVCWDKQQFMPTLSACEYIWTSFDCPAKIISCTSTDLNRQHPTQKPIILFQKLLQRFSKEGDTVLDCYLGSGTTAVACKLLGRNYIGIEKEQKYVDIALDRIKAIDAQPNLF
jgi:site-specific DNA-methyltransferase (adenine-specific)